MTSMDPSINIDHAQAEALRLGIAYGRVMAGALGKSEHFSFNKDEQTHLRQSLHVPIKMVLNFLMEDNEFPLAVRIESLHQSLTDFQESSHLLDHWKRDISVRVQIKQMEVQKELMEQQMMLKMSMEYFDNDEDEDFARALEIEKRIKREKQRAEAIMRRELLEQQSGGGKRIAIDPQELPSVHRTTFEHILGRAQEYLKEFGKAATLDIDTIVIESGSDIPQEFEQVQDIPVMETGRVSAKRDTSHLFSPAYKTTP